MQSKEHHTAESLEREFAVHSRFSSVPTRASEAAARRSSSASWTASVSNKQLLAAVWGLHRPASATLSSSSAPGPLNPLCLRRPPQQLSSTAAAPPLRLQRLPHSISHQRGISCASWSLRCIIKHAAPLTQAKPSRKSRYTSAANRKRPQATNCAQHHPRKTLPTPALARAHRANSDRGAAVACAPLSHCLRCRVASCSWLATGARPIHHFRPS